MHLLYMAPEELKNQRGGPPRFESPLTPAGDGSERRGRKGSHARQWSLRLLPPRSQAATGAVDYPPAKFAAVLQRPLGGEGPPKGSGRKGGTTPRMQAPRVRRARRASTQPRHIGVLRPFVFLLKPAWGASSARLRRGQNSKPS